MTLFLGWFFYEKPEPPFVGADPIATEISDVFDKIQSYEDSAMISQGQYIQFKSDGKTRDGVTKQTWDKSDWSGIPNLPIDSLVSYGVDVYHSKIGDGYVIRAEYEDTDAWYLYERHVGAETYRDSKEDMITRHPKNPRK